MKSGGGKVIVIGGGYWRPDGIAGSLRRRGVEIWLDWHDKGGIRDNTDWFEEREHAIRAGSGFLLYLREEQTFSSDEVELTRLAVSRGMRIFAFRTSEKTPVPAFLNEFEPLIYDFFGPPKKDEDHLDQLACALKDACARRG